MKHIRYIADPPQSEHDYRTYQDAAAEVLVASGAYEYYDGPLRPGDTPNAGTKLSKADAKLSAPAPQIQNAGITIAGNEPDGATPAPEAPPLPTAETLATES